MLTSILTSPKHGELCCWLAACSQGRRLPGHVHGVERGVHAAQGSETLGDLGGPHGGYRALLYAFAAMHWAVLLSGCAAAPHLHPLVLMGAHSPSGWGALLS